jgi:hypothetical protein
MPEEWFVKVDKVEKSKKGWKKIVDDADICAEYKAFIRELVPAIIRKSRKTKNI